MPGTDDDQLLDDDDELDSDRNSDSDDDASGEPETITVEQFRALTQEVATLRSQQAQTSKDAMAAIGRAQALQKRLDETPDNSDLIEQMQESQDSVTEALVALIEDETADPRVQARARTALAKQPTPEARALLKRVRELEKGGNGRTADPDPEAQQQNPVSRIQAELETEIRDYGFDPDDPKFDWKGKATQLLQSGDVVGLRTYFRNQIRELQEAAATANRRQARKKVGEKDGKPAGDASDELSADRPIEDRLARLRSLGAI
jgi:hypothetical protein